MNLDEFENLYKNIMVFAHVLLGCSLHSGSNALSLSPLVRSLYEPSAYQYA